MRFDLENWGDGTLRLVHWDSLHGDDIVLEIRLGAAYEHKNDETREVNLTSYLENLMMEAAKELEAE